MRTPAPYETTLLSLAGDSTVSVHMLVEDEDLIAMIREGAPYLDCLAYVNENY